MTNKRSIFAGFTLFFMAVLPVRADQEVNSDQMLTLEQAIRYAVEAGDPSVQAFHEQAEGENRDAVAAGALPDPRVSVGLANVPVDTLDLNREPMTQVQLAVRQNFPRGSTRRLTARTRTLRAAELEAEAEARRDRLVRDVSAAWFNAHYTYVAEKELTNLHALLGELNAQQESDFATSGSAALQRIYATELEQALVQDRLDRILQERQHAVELLARFIGKEKAIRPPKVQEINEFNVPSAEQIDKALAKNPMIVMSEHRIEVSRTKVALAREAFKPEFGIEARYGRRGGDRADFGSVMVTFDVPIWASRKQEPALKAAKYRQQSASLEREALSRDLWRQANSYLSDIRLLQDRLDRFEGTTIARAEDAVEASRNAYGAGNIDFAELVRTEVSLRDVTLRMAELRRDQNIAITELRYLVGEIK